MLSSFQNFLTRTLAPIDVNPIAIEKYEKVSNQLPARPRLRVETLKGEKQYDLLPAFDMGRVVPNYWQLPAQRAATRTWWSPIASTSQLAERMRALGLRVRVLA